MNLNATNEQNIIERDIHCPFCQGNKALLISGLAAKSSSILLPPAFGLKYWLCLIFTFGIHAITHGLPWIEKKRRYEFATYGFCPQCGKKYDAGAPNAVSGKNEQPKFYKSLRQKKVLGVCGGIAEYTGLSIKLVRLGMVLFGLAVMPAIFYVVAGLILDYSPEHGGQ
ncbi:MAG: PspC domain-containing protein [Oscillospiraceae bacterium]|nr:PspC domain-containing protein [Oscillospiraceae bacterium]